MGRPGSVRVGGWTLYLYSKESNDLVKKSSDAVKTSNDLVKKVMPSQVKNRTDFVKKIMR